MLSETYNIDCMEYMRSLPDKAFDLAIVDPPYGDGRSQFVQVERERERESSRTTDSEIQVAGSSGTRPWSRFGQRFDRYKITEQPEQAVHGPQSTAKKS